MDLTGLTETERARLDAAGFDAGVAAAVAEEAQSMRFLWLRRSGFNAVTGVAGAAGAAAVANVFAEDFGPLGAYLPILLPLIAAALGLAPWWEIRQVKAVSRTRWAARKLAALAVAADPDDETDDEWVELQHLAATVSGARSTRDALNAAADALDAQDAGEDFTRVLGGGIQGESAAVSGADSNADTQVDTEATRAASASGRRNPAPSRMTPAPARAMTPDQRDRLYDAIRAGIVIAALVALLILLLIRRQMGA